MTVTCPNCQTVYRIDPAKVPPGGVRARCAVCQGVFAVAPEPSSAAVPVREEPRVAAPPPSPSAAPAAAPEPPPAPPPVVAPARPAMPRPAGAPPAHAPAFAPPARAAGQPLAAPSGFSASAVAAPSLPPPPVRPGAPVNPFLSQDPRQKARRLARALVSDIAVYHADRRREALRAGRLKEAFAEEIKKSWEEYTVQVGRDLAESTPFFTEALNEILAEGQPVF
ncbi:MAG TPA: zinc-ribbon domain-containing protein [Gemmatimonadales bacterium]|nr:zinc-ribbon domain-containing protein [Gemmatimonadales bacterium]